MHLRHQFSLCMCSTLLRFTVMCSDVRYFSRLTAIPIFMLLFSHNVSSNDDDAYSSFKEMG